MSESEITFDEELSADLFSDIELSTGINNVVNSDSSSMSIGINEPEPSDDIPEWKGMSMNEIRKGLGVYEHQEHPPVVVSPHHTVLFTLPLPARGPPRPYPSHQLDKWSQGYVRMPHSAHSLYPIEQRNGSRCCRNRWEMIQEALLRSILSSQQLEEAILSYNQIYAQRWNFAALHYFFSEIMDEEETTIFFETLMPKIVQLALQLPMLLTGAVPLLKRHTNGCISLSQLQVASLLANAFFCTFPRRNSSNPQSEYASYPHINFNRLFAAYNEEKHNRCTAVMEKIKCLFHYFRRVTSKVPEGVITIERRYIPPEDCPKWHSLVKKLPSLHITSKGTIENEGAGFLQVDFANKYVGGGVLGLGCVQEEIRFVICPELMVTMLVTEELDDTEALIVSGIERYSKYEGYSSTFKWKGDFVDETPRDSSGRRMTSVVAIDALYFKQSSLQFNISNVTRELNKAYVGFVGSDVNKENLSAIATGNWGCGAFHGNPKLKVLIQLMAAAVAGRSMVYFTFGDTNLRDEVATMYAYLIQHDVDIARIFSMLSEYHRDSASSSARSDFYRFLYNRSKMKSLSKYFTKTENSTSKNHFAVCPRDMSLKSNRDSPASRKDVENKRYFLYSKAPEEEVAEEERILNWLTSCDSDDNDDNEKPGMPESLGNEKDNSKEIANNSRNGGAYENRSADNALRETDANEKQWPMRTIDDKISHSLGGDVNSLNSREAIIQHPRDASKKIKSELSLLRELSDKESAKIIKDCLPESRPLRSPTRKTGQRKISEFFQRTL
ncbi:PREDICTED: poly(ADP-ribose) glycohydrolase-like [Dinoponera quadriceps]|uniref:poly(ADP-ribose) glycohydrolase n=1 Tax=Dinoponera quadriceps TaxID=609295 RepID=A0A6P3WXM8_DINQU|nr:PREDICTED: poly(ADP-ribose) glycohydrolase-like [Dinoponera quadriceps]